MAWRGRFRNARAVKVSKGKAVQVGVRYALAVKVCFGQVRPADLWSGGAVVTWIGMSRYGLLGPVVAVEVTLN